VFRRAEKQRKPVAAASPSPGSQSSSQQSDGHLPNSTTVSSPTPPVSSQSVEVIPPPATENSVSSLANQEPTK